ncbi:glucans biosynthesis glucosyltransferase MdoH [Algiphilus sp. W345]|uniref:Glucans biosynthesis glucosyltransferase H n=1 Tax=Banduia mediterranea TaxID=3075609 RepID=A0ABU2WGV5_9GAMM|nr:glucans biosynthesis glucosyltransferase MdoH [Algiphilus sp. W345]MDT0496780.1 glucans biosynthesis glucosyltransferase MdoH [Algiphilus sp. W345]
MSTPPGAESIEPQSASRPSASAASRAAFDAYLGRLPLDESQRRSLRELAGQQGQAAAFEEAHRRLAGSENPESSIALRIRNEHPRAPLVRDLQGRFRLITTPPLSRASMRPEALSRNLFVRFGRSLRSRLLGKRRRLAVGETDAPKPETKLPAWAVTGTIRRLLLLCLVIGQTIYGTYFMTAVLPYHGQDALELTILILYAILFAWVSAGFWTALMGFWALLSGRDKYAISATAEPDAAVADNVRTAILMPICNEDVHRVFAGLRATFESTRRTGQLPRFDFYILSDSSEADVRVAEVEAWMKLCEEVDGFGHIFYRRRQHRIKRKSGNVADWCRRWGSGYKYMVILDADSVMSGDCLYRLAQLMEANPTAGIIQTAPMASGRDTLYARIQQFATRCYGPLFTAGLHFWQLGESHYWGHNAMIRVAPFIRHCALSKLPGSGPLAGEIMSHDFVEAALMRRAGWGVWIAYDLPGSHEEMPPALLDELQRDQRWCQGNLQNFRLFLAQGLHPAHRAVFMTGVMAYLSAPLWFIFLVLSTASLARHELVEPEYFSQPYQLFPTWPEWHPEWALQLFGATMTLLFLPKILAALLLILRGRSKPFGGAFKLIDSLLFEMLFSAILAPIRMLFHARYVSGALLGFGTKWKSPPRDDAATPWSEALRRHGSGTVLGLAWAAFVYWLNPTFLWWLAPIAGSLIIAIPMSVLSSRVTLGRWCRQRKLFLIPEETAPPEELRALATFLKEPDPYEAGFLRAVAEPVANAIACASGRPRTQIPMPVEAQRRERLEQDLKLLPTSLSDTERNFLLGAPDLLSSLHQRIWSDPAIRSEWRRGVIEGS